VLAGLVDEPLGVLVGNRYRQFLEQLGDRGKHRRGVRELRKDHEPHRRNGALPATAESIMCSMRSVLTRICRRSSGFGMSVWQAAAE